MTAYLNLMEKKMSLLVNEKEPLNKIVENFMGSYADENIVAEKFRGRLMKSLSTRLIMIFICITRAVSKWHSKQIA